MRTKQILGTFMLAAMAVACTNEEQLDNVMTGGAAQNGRISLGEVTLNIGEPNSRYVIGDNFNDLLAEVGDQVGAALIDLPNSKAADVTDAYKLEPKVGYDLTDYISTNYSYKYDGTNWKSEANMVEGNYMFYAPYNANHASRQPITVKLDAVQQLVANADGTIDELSAIKQLKDSKNVMAVSHEFLAQSGSKSIKTNLLPIYAYPLITLTNNYMAADANGNATIPTDLVINQVVIRNTAGGFMTEATINNTSDNDNSIDTEGGFVNQLRNFTYNKLKADGVTVEEKTATGAYIKVANKNSNAWTSSLLNDVKAENKTAAIVVKAPANGLKLAKNGGKVQFYAVIPAENYSENGIEIDVYTNEGVFNHTVAAPAISAGKRYAVAEYKDGVLITTGEAGSDDLAGSNYTFDMETVEENTESNIVATSADLVALIKNTPATVKDDNGDVIANTLKVTPLNSNVEVNAAVMSAIMAKSKAEFTVIFDAPATISTSISTNKFVEFTNGAIVNGSEITLGTGAKFSTEGTLTVKEGSTVTLNGVTFDAATIENKGGTINIESAINTLTNTSGTVNVQGTADSNKEITYNGTIENAGGDIVVAAGTNATTGYKTYKNIRINNPKGNLTVGEHATLTNGVATNGLESAGTKGTITNYGNMKVSMNEPIYGIVNNYGIISLGKNNGLIVAASGDAKITVWDGTGRIKNNMDAEINKNGGTNTVYYEYTENISGDLQPEAGIVDLVVLNGMTWTPGDLGEKAVGYHVEMVDATISLYAANAEVRIPGLRINNSASNKTSTIKGASTSVIKIAGAKQNGTYSELDIKSVDVKFGQGADYGVESKPSDGTQS